MSTKIFITGATGFIGNEVAKAFLQKGFEVTALARSDRSAEVLKQNGFKIHRGDITQPETYKSVLKEFDVIVHTAATNDQKFAEAEKSVVETVLNELEGTNKTFVYTTGVWVLGNTGNKPADETTPTKPINLVSWRVSLENKVLDAARNNIRTIVIRPAIVYGSSQGIIANLIQEARGNTEARYINQGENRWSTVHVEDLAQLYVLANEKAKPGTLLHAADENAIVTLELAKEIAAIVGKPGKIKAITVQEATQNYGAFAEGLALDQQVSAEKARKEFGWNPRHTLREELKREEKVLAGATR